MKSIRRGFYRHFRNGKYYYVVGCARHSETEEPLVVYRALYGARGLWVRPLAMFAERVEHEGKLVRRFAPVPPAKVPAAIARLIEGPAS